MMDELRKLLRRAMRDRNLALLDVPEPPTLTFTFEPSDATHPVGEMALAAAEAEWLMNVAEPDGPNWQRIDHYIRSDEGLGWSWEKRYIRNRQFAWCGAFVAYCWGRAGLKAEIRKKRMPSCYRLYRWARGTARLITSGQGFLPGDVVIVGDEQSPRWGSHVTLCIEQDRSHVFTYEGNAHGPGPDGNVHEGVVKRKRPLKYAAAGNRYRAMHAIRFLEEDLDLS
jgi:hypothetical protein